MSQLKVGVFADVANMYRNGGQRMQYNVLREFASRDNYHIQTLTAYVTFDEERASTDDGYADGALDFHDKLRQYGYKVVISVVKWYYDEDNNRVGKANADIRMAVDCLTQSRHLDKVIICSGDGDFKEVIQTMQAEGKSVEIVGLHNSSRVLRTESNLFISGFSIPGLIPFQNTGGSAASWLTSLDALSIKPKVDDPPFRVRGWCYWYDLQRGFGYMRFLLPSNFSNLHIVDARNEDSPFLTAYFHHSELRNPFQRNSLPSQEMIFEFTLGLNKLGEQTEPQYQCKEVYLLKSKKHVRQSSTKSNVVRPSAPIDRATEKVSDEPDSHQE